MAKNLAPRNQPPEPVKRRRGRPPKPGGATPHVEVQRAYRARLRQAGKVERVVDAAVFEAIQSRAAAAAPARPDFDPETQFICERAVFRQLRDDLERAATKLKLREEDVARIEKRNAYLEAELKRVEQHNGAILKELIALRQEREQEQKAPKRRARDPLRR